MGSLQGVARSNPWSVLVLVCLQPALPLHIKIYFLSFFTHFIFQKPVLDAPSHFLLEVSPVAESNLGPSFALFTSVHLALSGAPSFWSGKLLAGVFVELRISGKELLLGRDLD
ncbi:unnamed protein product [Mortierella alpina]